MLRRMQLITETCISVDFQVALWQDCGRKKWKVTVTDGNECNVLHKPLILLVAATRIKIN
jgi:hypothetical protein